MAEAPQGFEELFVVQQLQYGGALAARDDEAVQTVKVRCRTHFTHFGAGAFECFCVGLEIALKGENADLKLLLLQSKVSFYQPRVCISSEASSFDTSSPGIASPSSSLASSSFTGSL